ncbi:hypothetical protein GWK47_001786 [Chionoecetes opilio]|uniref:Uncharacterized protein n=1 Tax=Chionoecetes opilio TaxID=41210 RepID=A0A8J5CJZ7_CHIOP|nr:hypothetical protein GWK47_001786 [Chionoecetes opilio]
MVGGVVVAVLFSLRFISVLDPASAQDCTAADHVVEQGNVQTVYQSKTNKNKVSTSLFVQPGTAFEGVSVEVTQLSNNTKFEAWFPNDQCYPNDATWVQLKVDVEAKTPENKTRNYLSFTTTIGNCMKTCTRYPTFYYIKSLSVVAHGSSKWNCTCPATTCLAPQVSSESPSISKCTEPPGLHRTPKTLTPATSSAADSTTSPAADSTTPATTTTAPYSTLLIIVVVMVVVVVVEQVALLVVVCSAASEGGGPCDAPDARSPEHVSMNSLYEPSGVYHNTAAGKDEEETTRPCTNSLYEPFNGLMYGPGGRDQQDMTRPCTNSLYEAFSEPIYDKLQWDT